MSLKVSSRLSKLRQKLTEKEIDGILISQPENRFYLSGFDGSAGYLIITSREAVLATDFRYTEQAKAQAPDFNIFRITGKLEEWFPKLVAELNLSRLGFEGENLTFSFFHQLTDVLKKAQSKVKLIPVDGLVESLRAVKEPEEIELITRAASLTDRAFDHIKERIWPGMMEKEIAWEIEKFFRENGSLSLPFEVIVASGPNSALPHAKPSERQINPGEPIVIDIGARIDGYSSDFTRTLYVGEADKTFKKVYDTVLGAQLTAMSIIKENMTGQEADKLARTVIEEVGYGESFGHGLGHGVGLVVHELPRLGPNSSDILVSGMVFTIEPGVYLPGWGGVRIEDLAVMEKGKLKLLSKASK